MNLIFITYMRFSYDTYTTATITGGEIPGNSRVARCAEAVKWSSGWDHLSDFNLNVDFEFGSISSPKSRNRWTLGNSYLRRWAKVRSRAFQSLQKSVKFCVITCSTICPAKVVSLSISKMWALLVLDGYQNLGCSFLCVKRKKDDPVLFPSYFEGTRPNKSQWMRSQRGQLIDIVMHQYWFSPKNSKKKDLLTTY